MLCDDRPGPRHPLAAMFCQVFKNPFAEMAQGMKIPRTPRMT
jgi:hypothetical protein